MGVTGRWSIGRSIWPRQGCQHAPLSSQRMAGAGWGGDVASGRLHCPRCGGRLQATVDRLRCEHGHQFEVDGGVARLRWSPPDDPLDSVSTQVERFYDRHPFPDYDQQGIDTLRTRAEGNNLARLLDQQIPSRATVLEVGCGTGQLTNFLASSGRSVLGIDLSASALALAEAFRSSQQIGSARFAQMDLFHPAIAERSFDVVIANGVLHHTADTEAAYLAVARLVAPSGFLIVGLYHRHGRRATSVRRALVHRVRRLTSLDPQARGDRDPTRRAAWVADQYWHPHESSHTFREVLGWMERAGIDYTSSLPTFGRSGDRVPDLFMASNAPCPDRRWRELSMAITNRRDGGLFVTVARRPGATAGQNSV